MVELIKNSVMLTGAVHAEAKGAEGIDAGAGALGPVAVRVAQGAHPPLRKAKLSLTLILRPLSQCPEEASIGDMPCRQKGRGHGRHAAWRTRLTC